MSPSTLPSMCRSSLPEISPFTCKLAPSRAVEPDGVVLSGRMASVLMAIPSVFAEAGLATGAGVSGGFAVVGCCISGFLLVHILALHGQGHLLQELVRNRGAKHCILSPKMGTRELRTQCSLK